MTSRFTVDARGKKAYLGSKVLYENNIWILEDIEYLLWSNEQYLTLKNIKNKNKTVNFISPNNIIAVKE